MRYKAARRRRPDLNTICKAMRLFAVSAALAAVISVGARAADDPEIIRGPYLVADAETGQVIEEFDALRPWYPASTSKMMTIYVTFQAIRAGEISLSDKIKYSANAAAQPPSKMGFKPGTTLTLDNALKMMMVKSANDIAVAVAEAVGGSVGGFAERMNAAAKSLGMTRSHFVNPHGLPSEGQVSSARDMALLARALLREFPERRPYYTIHAIQIGDKILRNYNKLLSRYLGTTGMKTGFICASGYNLVASARRDGRELIAVVFGQYSGKLRNEHAAALLDAAFAPPHRRVETETTLFNTTSGESYHEPFNMRPYVCTAKRRAAIAALKEEMGETDDGPVSHLTELLDLGPPVRVSANIPADYGEPGFVARLPLPRPNEGPGPEILEALAPSFGEPGFAAPLPKPRPGEESEPEVLDAFAPTESGTSTSAPAEAIGAATGQPQSLQDVGSE
jgi:D-alanyl-D-alanine carboxypeptidase